MSKEHLDIVKLLIQAKVDVDARDENHNTPLSLAIETGEPFVEVLVEAGATDDGLTELQRAAREGDLARVRKMIEDGADVNERGARRITAMHVASEAGRANVIEMLITAKAWINVGDEKGMMPLHRAGNAAVAERLLAAGALVDADSWWVLLQHGADVNARTRASYYGGVRTPLDMTTSPELRALLEASGGRSAAD